MLLNQKRFGSSECNETSRMSACFTRVSEAKAQRPQATERSAEYPTIKKEFFTYSIYFMQLHKSQRLLFIKGYDRFNTFIIILYIIHLWIYNMINKGTLKQNHNQNKTKVSDSWLAIHRRYLWIINKNHLCKSYVVPMRIVFR